MSTCACVVCVCMYVYMYVVCILVCKLQSQTQTNTHNKCTILSSGLSLLSLSILISSSIDSRMASLQAYAERIRGSRNDTHYSVHSTYVRTAVSLRIHAQWIQCMRIQLNQRQNHNIHAQYKTVHTYVHTYVCTYPHIKKY